MSALLVGSRALRHWYKDARYPRDWDLFVNQDAYGSWLERYQHLIEESRESRENKYVYILKSGVKIEVEVAEPGDSVSEFLEINETMCRRYSWMCKMPVFGFDAIIAPATTLQVIKRSHIYWPHNWTKHIRDYHFLKTKELTPSSEEEAAAHLRLEEKKEGNPDKTIFSLNVSNDEFFDASEALLCRFFEHDDIHAATCYYDEPLYRKAKRDTSKAMVDKDLFEAMSQQDKCRMVREEVFVIALERRIIPHLCEPSVPGEELIPEGLINSAFNYAIMRICTSLTRGWFREFAIENYPEICTYKTDFVKKFLVALKAGKVRQREVSSGQTDGE